MRPAPLVLLGSLLPVLVACASLSATPERLPTRAVTPVPTPTPTFTPFRFSARDYYKEGRTRQEAGDIKGAVQSFTRAIQLMSDFSPAYVARGTAYLAQGRHRLALADADAALKLDPTSATAHVLRAETLRLLGRALPALEAFDRALILKPSLKAETFRSRWLAARAAHDDVRLAVLSREYHRAHAGDPLRHYYQGWALIEQGAPVVAARALAEGIESSSDPPALLWFTLGQAYAASDFWAEAIIAFEAARALVEIGDASLAVHSDRPIADLFVALGQAYLGAGRCVDAETMLEYAIAVGVAASEGSAKLEEARVCLTPTPTATPYPTTTPPRP